MPRVNTAGEEHELRRVNWEKDGDARVETCPFGDNVKVVVLVENEDGEKVEKTKKVRMRPVVECAGCSRFRGMLDDGGHELVEIQKAVGTGRIDRVGMVRCCVVKSEEDDMDPVLKRQIDKANKGGFKTADDDPEGPEEPIEEE